MARFSRFWRSPWSYFLGLSILKLWLIGHLPIRASYAGYDNLRYVILASNFLALNVPYDSFTLVRQPGYPAFIFLSYLLGIPLRFSQEIIYLAGGFILAWSCHKYYFNKSITFIFSILYIFAPFSFHWNRQTLADVLYLPLTAWIVACLIHISNSKTDRTLIAWSLGLGIGLAWFWNTRLEGIWIVPSIAFIYSILALKYWFYQHKIEFKKSAIVFAAIVLPVVVVTSGISWINYTRYGIFDTNDLKSAGVEEAYSSLEKVTSKKWQPMVEISRSMRERVYAISPSFRQLQPYIESDNHWRKSSCESGICDDYAAGLFYWVLRESVAQAGYYQSAPKTEQFYHQIAREIDTACHAKTLNCEFEKPLAFLPDFHFQYIPLWVNSIGKLSHRLMQSSLVLKLDSGEEDRELREQYYAQITREPANFFNERSYLVNQFKDRSIFAISRIFNLGFTVLLGLSSIGFGLEAIALVRTKFRDRSISFAFLGLLLSCIVIRVVLIAYIDVTSWFVDSGDRYLRPILPMFWLVICIGLTCFWKCFDRLLLTARNTRMTDNK
ncbi:MAG TPA: hypothetical protein IGS17_17045 [Oscillatoriales cyanobacterium M59_W2019_021]|nr:hypothetical protein [Oscillatoriales cyanobacterium M4454_W2019_049]HIK52613.1 hypothetical protein [Oscillatoriales cyanobacterium M59_W2019_021]